jgi:hypothetical protein
VIRPDVTVRREGDRVTLVDPLFGRAPSLPAAAFDAPDDALLRSLALLHLLDRDDPTVARMRDLRAGKAPMQVTALPGARFACQGSGGCCSNYVFGPLTDADVARVTGHVGDGWFETRPDGTRFLRTTEAGTCVFHEGARCGLHARFGGGSKPAFCQLFPLMAWPTVTGLRIVDNGECLSFDTSSRAGDPLRAAFAEVQDLLPAGVALQHPVVAFPGGQCDFGFFLPLQDAWVASAGDLRACGGAARDWLAELARFSPAEGPRFAFGSALPAGPDDALRAVAADVHALFSRMQRPPPFQREVLAGLEALAPSPPDLGHAFRHHLFGPRALVRNRPLPALIRLALLARVAGSTGLPVATRRLMVPWPPLEEVWVRHEPRWAEVVAAQPR